MANIGGPPGGPIDWDARAPEHLRRIAAARARVPATVVARAMSAYENAPPGTGLEDRMALAIYAVLRRNPALPPAVIHTADGGSLAGYRPSSEDALRQAAGTEGTGRAIEIRPGT